MRRLLGSLLLLAAVWPAAAARADGPAGTRIVVARDAGLSAGQRASLRSDAGVQLLHTTRLARVEVDVARGDAGDALAALRADPGVRWAEVDHRRSAFADPPDDPLYGSEWALPEINAPDAWSSATGAGVTVAIVDSGADASHPDLAGAIDPASRDLVGDGGSDFADGAGHGTHVAGIVGARRDNGIGVAGVAPDADLLILRALDDAGSGYDSDIAEAFDAAADAGARIVNASLGGTGGGTILETAIAAHPGTLFVVAAGNDGRSDDSTPEYPCSLPDANVLCVGASTASDRRASFSNYGRRSVDVFAPGQGILSTYPAALQSPPATGYATLDGTSMATPMVSGEAALLLQAAPSLSTAALKDAILSSGVAGSSYATRSVSGKRIDVAAALAQVTSSPAPLAPVASPAPTPTISPTPTPTATPRPTATPTPTPAASPRPAAAPAATATPVATPTPATPPVPLATPLPTAIRVRLLVRLDHRHHRARAFAAAPAARLTLELDRRVCARHRCRWRRAARVRSHDGVAALSRRLRHGRYRATARAAGTLRTRRFRL